ncbi:phasin [Rhodopseudomonas palustris]|uniref:Phasin 2 n=1 Tax=Rhodopseudomonas palustris (strain BisB18) TaxID=316056 RepID=Q218G6_RHOPB
MNDETHTSYQRETQSDTAVLDSVNQAFTPVTDALKNIQNLDVPEATRDFVKRAAGTAKEKAADIHAGSEKVTAVIESAVSNSVAEAAKISRNIQHAIYQDAEAFFAGIDKLASAKSVNEVVQIQSDLVRSQGEVLISRAKSATEYLGRLVTDSARTAQDNLDKVYSKTA